MKATVAYEADLLPVSTYTPVQAVMSEKTSHIRAIDHSISGRRPTRPGRNANATELAKLNMALVAVIRVVWISLVMPADLSMLLR